MHKQSLEQSITGFYGNSTEDLELYNIQK